MQSEAAINNWAAKLAVSKTLTRLAAASLIFIFDGLDDPGLKRFDGQARKAQKVTGWRGSPAIKLQ